MNKSAYPKIRELQNAHRKLIQEYIDAVDSVSRLPFFINLSRLLSPFEEETFHERITRRGYFIYTPVTWKPFVAFLVEIHIKSKLSELDRVYRQLALQLPMGNSYKPHREWLKTAIQDCSELSSTLSTWRNTQTLSAAALPVFAGWIGTILSIESVSDLLSRLGIQVSRGYAENFLILIPLILWLTLTTTMIAVLIYQAFHAKRALFLPVFAIKKVNVSVRNVYETETRLFDLIGRRKIPELAIDNIVMFFVIGFTLMLFAPFALSRGLSLANQGLRILVYSILLYSLTIIGLLFQSLRRWN